MSSFLKCRHRTLGDGFISRSEYRHLQKTSFRTAEIGSGSGLAPKEQDLVLCRGKLFFNKNRHHSCLLFAATTPYTCVRWARFATVCCGDPLNFLFERTFP